MAFLSVSISDHSSLVIGLVAFIFYLEFSKGYSVCLVFFRFKEKLLSHIIPTECIWL